MTPASVSSLSLGRLDGRYLRFIYGGRLPGRSLHANGLQPKTITQQRYLDLSERKAESARPVVKPVRLYPLTYPDFLLTPTKPWPRLLQYSGTDASHTATDTLRVARTYGLNLLSFGDVLPSACEGSSSSKPIAGNKRIAYRLLRNSINPCAA